MDIKEVLENNTDLREKLFIRGFLITDSSDISADGFPFYGEWKDSLLGGFHFWSHPLTGFHYVKNGDVTAFILGHCYNPFTMEISEEICLARILEHYDRPDLFDYIDEITGVFVLGFIENGKITFLTDPSGMQSGCYGTVGGNFYISSHPQLIGDLCDLQMSDFCRELVSYKWYKRVMGPYLPADMEPFEELKRIVPNIVYASYNHEVSHRRFYPLQELAECRDDEEYREVIESAADILKNNMELVLQKWPNAWQSLTGGIDSNTTFAAANGHYEHYHTFSYLSAPKEVPDVEAAKTISEHFDVPWTLYEIPEDDSSINHFEEKKAILAHNSNEIGPRLDNEYRKRMILDEQCKADIEIKSWVSETIRAYWYKHYGKNSFPQLSPKLFRNLYKIFLGNRMLAHKIDGIYSDYIKEYEYDSIPAQYPIADMNFCEVTWGSWGGMSISEMKYSYDITFIYNNRKFLDLLFKVPLEKRISDQHHLDMKRYLNPELADMGIRVINLKETGFRAFMLNNIFNLNQLLP